ncbi:discoidin domain-containing protein [Flagellimonas sp. HMM57]|uniref:discoidin domain-containing protein n=1 Tax=unclassified Flagellimonas TaxID=2644544 RepID=UPI0013CFDEB0|nr:MULTISPECIES: discoidin domain-containing protein [unclassified Flagellimonas]UII75350.1 discoidin domain-containing protein [Flagellimonas sp. HMM57]
MSQLKNATVNTRNSTASALLFVLIFLCGLSLSAQNNLSSTATATSSGFDGENEPSLTIDGDATTKWVGKIGEDGQWLLVVLPGATEIVRAKISLVDGKGNAIPSFALQTYLNGFWEDEAIKENNTEKEVVFDFKKPLLTDRLRLSVTGAYKVTVSEFEIYGQDYVSKDATPVRKILVNQSGYNLGKPKRFTAPELKDGALFSVINHKTGKKEYQGKIKGGIGDFSEFNPLSDVEYQVAVDTSRSHPFRIGPFWLERVSYQNMMDFMAGARHYTGTTDEIMNLSWAWRDGDFFNWALQTLIAQYLSNPEAYKQMDSKISYVPNTKFPKDYEGKWGELKPYKETAPDIVKLIHWDVDVKISQELEHEHQKAELAHFLYAFPYLKEWLPQQNFEIVYKYLKRKWSKEAVRPGSTTKYDKSEGHNLFALKTKLGTTKGELPPGHSVIPNLMMYEVAKRQGDGDADSYFNAAYRQMEWMIAHLNWEDPITTKGQRMSEHMTMRAFAYFLNQYPKKAPSGLYEKVMDWAQIVVRRSNNMWDFRKYTDNEEWIPIGWNETGNVLGFPACALAAASIIKDGDLNKRLMQLVWSHFDNAFGRNPTGRHFSYDGPNEIEGVDLGWYSYHEGGIGRLSPVRFVFDGSPKTNHYPNYPAIGNYGWTEGWVQFNTAFNMSMAYLANSDIKIEVRQIDKKTLKIKLKAPINFNQGELAKARINMSLPNGDNTEVELVSEGKYATYLSGTIPIETGGATKNNVFLPLKKGDEVTVSYGYGYFEKVATLTIE